MSAIEERIAAITGSWALPLGWRFDLIVAAFLKYTMRHCPLSPTETLETLERLDRMVAAHFPRRALLAVPALTPASASIVLETDRLDPPECFREFDGEKVPTPIRPNGFRALTVELFPMLLEMNPRLIDAVEIMMGPREPARASGVVGVRTHHHPIWLARRRRQFRLPIG